MGKIELGERFASGNRSQLAKRLLDSYQFDGKGVTVWSESLILLDKPLLSIGLASDTNPASFGTNITFTANLSDTTATGTVQIDVDGTSYGIASVVKGVAIFHISTISVGTHTIVVTYSGDGKFNGATSPNFTQRIT